MEYVIFALNTQKYAVPVQSTQEVIDFSDESLAELSQVPEFIEGVMNLRGDVVAVVNLRKRLAIEQTHTEKRMLILKNEQIAAILVDNVYHVVNIEETDIQTPPSGLQDPYVASIWNDKGNIVFLLNIQKLLDFKIREPIVEKSKEGAE